MTAILSSRLVFVVLLALSCAAAEERVAPEQAGDENEVRRLQQENEALRRQLKEKDEDSALREQYIAQVTRSLNDVQDNLTALTQKQQDLSRTYVGMIEEQKQVSVSQRDDLMQKISSLRNELAATAAALKEARRQAEGTTSKARVVELVQLVEKLQAEVERRNSENEILHQTVANLQLDLEKRDQVIVAQTKTIEDSNVIIERKEKENVELILDTYRVWYRVDTFDRLKEDHVIEYRGGGVWMLSRSKLFDPGKLKEKHKSALPEITIDKPKRRLKLITIHPEGTYEMVQKSRHETVFRILEREAFWAGSPYLVIAVK